MNQNSKLLLVFILLAYAGIGWCQDGKTSSQTVELNIAGSALIAVHGPPVKIALIGATQAGEAIQESSENDASRLRITSLVTEGEARSISATISEELVGTELLVELKTPNSNFFNPDKMGDPTGLKVLSSSNEETLIEGIGTCWSGTADGDGYVIRYMYRAIPGAPLLKGSTITVTYTISSIASDKDV